MTRRLEEMTLKELWQLFPIELSEHRPEWSEWAEQESARLADCLSGFPSKITHIGSTAIPHIAAKPIVDLLVELPRESDFSKVRDILHEAGYICMSSGADRMSFNRGYTPDGYAEKVYHLHLRRAGDNDEILFRDYLRANPGVAKMYERLKLSLLPRYRNDRDGYTEAKSDFIRHILSLAHQSDDGWIDPTIDAE